MAYKPSAGAIERRFSKKQLTETQIARMERIRAAVTEAVKTCVAETPGCAEQSRAINKCDEALILFFLAVARNG